MNTDINNMDSIRAYRFRIYPNNRCRSEIDMQLNLSKNFYNKLLEKSKDAYGKDRSFRPKRSTFNTIKKEIISENKDFLKIYSQTRCEIEDRVIKAYANFFRRVKERKQGKKVKVGFPRFKSADRYYSIVYPQDNGSFSIGKERKTDMIRVSRIGRMKIELHRNMEGRIKTLTIKKEGKEYYAVFTAERIINPPKIEDSNPVGIDMGLNNFIALSDGKTIQKPKFFKQEGKRIARWQRTVARRNKGSHRRNKAKEKLHREWNDITNQSNDFMHKLSGRLIHEGYTSFAVEALHIQNTMKDHRLAQSIQNASWSRFINMLSYKAESAGMKVNIVGPTDTTQECSNCHNINARAERLTLKDRIYHCNVCGMTMDRDVNASINILHRATTLGQRGSHAQGDMTSAVQQESKSRIDELRTDKTHPLRDAVIA
jgi:putative transposase